MIDSPALEAMFGVMPSEVAWLATNHIHQFVFLFKQPPRFQCEDCVIGQDGDRIRVRLCSQHVEQVMA